VTEVGAAMKTAGATIRPKKKCCKDKPRCKRCPVVCKKLMRAGYLERAGSKYVVLEIVPKAELKAARAR
jgi:aldehyde:ferredoxin oxidoreductase